MSSQGLNAATFNANTNYLFVPGLAGIPQGFRIQSSSDYTTQLNQKAMSLEQNPRDFSNSTRLKLKFATQICPNNACAGGPFPA